MTRTRTICGLLGLLLGLESGCLNRRIDDQTKPFAISEANAQFHSRKVACEAKGMAWDGNHCQEVAATLTSEACAQQPGYQWDASILRCVAINKLSARMCTEDGTLVWNGRNCVRLSEQYTFGQFCQQGANLADDLRRTVDALKELAGQTDCQAAEAALSSREAIALPERQLVSLAPLHGFDRLIRLDVRKNQLRDLSDLRALTQLKALDVYDNEVTSVTVLAYLPELDTLDLGRNPISNIVELRGLSKLKSFRMAQTPLGSPGPGGVPKSEATCPQDAASDVLRAFCKS